MDTIKIHPYHITEFPNGVTVNGKELSNKQAPSIIIAASDSQYPEHADYVCDGVDDQVEIQAAHDEIDVYTTGDNPELHGKSGANILILPGKYLFSGGVYVDKSVFINGSGFTNTEVTMADNANSSAFIFQNYNQTIQPTYGSGISHILIRGNKANQTCDWWEHAGIRANVSDAYFDHIWIDDFEVGIYSSNMWSVYFNQLSIEQCTEGIYCNCSTDSEIKSIIFEGLNLHNRLSIRSRVSGSKASAIRIQNSYMGYGGLSEEMIHIAGNVQDCSIRDSYFMNDRAAGKYDILFEDHAIGDPTDISIKDNFFKSTGGSGHVYISPNAARNMISRNHFAHATPIIEGGANVGGHIRDNIGFITENVGTATLLSASTSIVVTHNLSVTPIAGDIMITPLETWGNMTNFWVDTYTATQFTIHADVAPGSDTLFAWKAIIL